MKKIAVILILLSGTVFAFQDYDIDGVEDAQDRCPDTPFDQLVGEDGCALDEKKTGELIFKIGTDISFDTLSDKTSSLNLFTSYSFDDFTFTLSNYSYYESYQDSYTGIGDLYLSGGYRIKNEDFHTFVTLGSKLSVSDDIGTGENDYYTSLSLDYFIDEKRDIFVYGGYTVSGDSREVDYENFFTFSIGGGYAFNSKYYSALSYDYSQSAYSGNDNYTALSWFHSYSFSKRYFTTFNYAYGLDDLSFDHTFSLKFGVHFD